jgi:hypothetical protein
MTSGGKVFAKVYKEQNMVGYAFLDKLNNTWRKVIGFPEGLLVGADGEDLVFAQYETTWKIVAKLPSSAVQVGEPWTRTGVSDIQPASR